jgi:hypothetical protein
MGISTPLSTARHALRGALLVHGHIAVDNDAKP